MPRLSLNKCVVLVATGAAIFALGCTHPTQGLGSGGTVGTSTGGGGVAPNGTGGATPGNGGTGGASGGTNTGGSGNVGPDVGTGGASSGGANGSATGGTTGSGSGGTMGAGTGGNASGSGGSGSGGNAARTGGSSAGTGGRMAAGGTGGQAVAGTGGRVATGGSGMTTGTGGSGTGGGSGNVMQPPPITSGGMNGWASRYWDCCKPACGWKANVPSGNAMISCNQQNQSLGGDFEARNACEGGGTAYMCWNGAPWSVSPTLSYGFAAASGSNYRCGRCYQLQFTGSGRHGANAGASSLNGKTMIVQVTNNGGVAGDQLDILIPGGGVGALNACTRQWGTSDLGAQYGGFLTGCNGDTNCVRQKCQTIFAGKPDLQAGCDWFLGWYNAADNPNLVFKAIACPAAITQRSGLQDPG